MSKVPRQGRFRRAGEGPSSLRCARCGAEQGPRQTHPEARFVLTEHGFWRWREGNVPGQEPHLCGDCLRFVPERERRRWTNTALPGPGLLDGG